MLINRSSSPLSSLLLLPGGIFLELVEPHSASSRGMPTHLARSLGRTATFIAALGVVGWLVGWLASKKEREKGDKEEGEEEGEEKEEEDEGEGGGRGGGIIEPRKEPKEKDKEDEGEGGG